MTSNSMLCLIIIVAVLGEAIATNYCDPALCDPTTIHTMCKYKSPEPSVKCNEVMKTAFTDEEKNSIVQMHNELRQVAKGRVPGHPPAAFMSNLTWDKELAEIAQRWTNQCSPSQIHDDCRDVDRFFVEQNWTYDMVEMTYKDSLSDAIGLVIKWIKEKRLIHRDIIMAYKDSDKIRNYANMISDIVTNFGCGYIEHKIGDSCKSELYCNYAPLGLIEDMPIYIIAE